MKEFAINYFRLKNVGLEFIYLKNSKIYYPEHNHTSIFNIGLVLDGEITLKKQHYTHNYNKDNCFLLFPYESHSLFTKSSYNILSICLSQKFVQNYEIKQAYKICKNVINQILDNKKFTTSSLANIYQMISHIYKNSYHFKPKNDNYLKLAQIYSQYAEKTLNLDQTAKLIHTSKYHLIREFKKTIGLTPHKFQLQKRIRIAQNLLDEATPLIDTTALITGFYDQSHFIRHFKNIVGITPTEYQKSNTNLAFNIKQEKI